MFHHRKKRSATTDNGSDMWISTVFRNTIHKVQGGKELARHVERINCKPTSGYKPNHFTQKDEQKENNVIIVR